MSVADHECDAPFSQITFTIATIDDRFEITVTMSTHTFFAYLLTSAVTGVSRMLMSIKNTKERYLLLSNHVVCESERTPPCFFPRI